MGLNAEGTGVLGAPPKLRSVQGGANGDTQVCELRVGFPRYRQDPASKEWKQVSIIWGRVEIWGNEAQRVFDVFNGETGRRLHVIDASVLPDEFEAGDGTRIQSFNLRARYVVPALSSVAELSFKPKGDRDSDGAPDGDLPLDSE